MARRVSPRTNRNCIGLSAMRSIVSSSAMRNSAPSPGRRPSYQSRVSRTSASASGLKLTRRLTLDPAAFDGLHPMGSPTQAAERDPPNVGPVRQHPRASALARPRVRHSRDSPRAPSRARRAGPAEASGARKEREAQADPLPSIRRRGPHKGFASGQDGCLAAVINSQPSGVYVHEALPTGLLSPQRPDWIGPRRDERRNEA